MLREMFSFRPLALFVLLVTLPDDIYAGPTGKIVGGEVIDIKKAPYQAYLPGCGGSLIGKKYVLTAAHCVESPVTQVQFGASVSGQGGKFVNVKENTIHPKYKNINGIYTTFDAAILTLAEEIQFTDTIKPVAMAKAGQIIQPGTILYTSGYGDTRRAGDKLRAVKQPSISLEECKKLYKKYTLTDDMLCAMVPEGGKSPCYGDSGGPAVDPNGVLVGVVSWGDSCTKPNTPAVYANVPAIRGWINEVTGL